MENFQNPLFRPEEFQEDEEKNISEQNQVDKRLSVRDIIKKFSKKNLNYQSKQNEENSQSLKINIISSEESDNEQNYSNKIIDESMNENSNDEIMDENQYLKLKYQFNSLKFRYNEKESQNSEQEKQIQQLTLSKKQLENQLSKIEQECHDLEQSKSAVEKALESQKIMISDSQKQEQMAQDYEKERNELMSNIQNFQKTEKNLCNELQIS